jgi:hypothetical protein
MFLSDTLSSASDDIEDYLASFLDITAGFELWTFTSVEEAYKFTNFAVFVVRSYNLGVEHDGVHHVCRESAGLGNQDADVN